MYTFDFDSKEDFKCIFKQFMFQITFEINNTKILFQWFWIYSKS